MSDDTIPPGVSPNSSISTRNSTPKLEKADAKMLDARSAATKTSGIRQHSSVQECGFADICAPAILRPSGKQLFCFECKQGEEVTRRGRKQEPEDTYPRPQSRASSCSSDSTIRDIWKISEYDEEQGWRTPELNAALALQGLQDDSTPAQESSQQSAPNASVEKESVLSDVIKGSMDSLETTDSEMSESSSVVETDTDDSASDSAYKSKFSTLDSPPIIEPGWESDVSEPPYSPHSRKRKRQPSFRRSTSICSSSQGSDSSNYPSKSRATIRLHSSSSASSSSFDSDPDSESSSSPSSSSSSDSDAESSSSSLSVELAQDDFLSDTEPFSGVHESSRFGSKLSDRSAYKIISGALDKAVNRMRKKICFALDSSERIAEYHPMLDSDEPSKLRKRERDIAAREKKLDLDRSFLSNEKGTLKNYRNHLEAQEHDIRVKRAALADATRSLLQTEPHLEIGEKNENEPIFAQGQLGFQNAERAAQEALVANEQAVFENQQGKDALSLQIAQFDIFRLQEELGQQKAVSERLVHELDERRDEIATLSKTKVDLQASMKYVLEVKDEKEDLLREKETHTKDLTTKIEYLHRKLSESSDSLAQIKNSFVEERIQLKADLFDEQDINQHLRAELELAREKCATFEGSDNELLQNFGEKTVSELERRLNLASNESVQLSTVFTDVSSLIEFWQNQDWQNQDGEEEAMTVPKENSSVAETSLNTEDPLNSEIVTFETSNGTLESLDRSFDSTMKGLREQLNTITTKFSAKDREEFSFNIARNNILSQLDEVDSLVSQSVTERENLHAELSSLKHNNSLLNARCIAIEASDNARFTENLNLMEEQDNLLKDLEVKRIGLQKMEEERDELADMAEKLEDEQLSHVCRDNLAIQLKDTQAHLGYLVDQCKILKCECDAKEAHLNACEFDLMVARLERDEFETELQDERHCIEELEKARDNLNNQLADANSRANAFESDLTNTQSERNKLEHELSNSKAQCNILTEKLRVTEDRLETVKSELSTLESERSNLSSDLQVSQARVKDQEKQRENLASQLHHSQSYIESLKLDLSNSQAERDIIASKLQQSKASVTTLKLDLENARRDLDESNAYIESLEIEYCTERDNLAMHLKDTEDLLEESKEQCKNLTSQIQKWKALVKSFETEVSDTQAERENLSSDLRDARCSLEELTAKHNSVTSEFQNSKDHIRDLELSIFKSQRVRHELATQIHQYQSRIESFEDKVSKAKAREDKLVFQLGSHLNRINALTTELAESKGQVSMLEQDLNDARFERDNLELQLSYEQETAEQLDRNNHEIQEELENTVTELGHLQDLFSPDGLEEREELRRQVDEAWGEVDRLQIKVHELERDEEEYEF